MSNEAKVGTFVIVAVIIFVYVFISVANVQLAGGKVSYRTYFTFAAGLDTGTLVRFGGLKAGIVDVVRPYADDPTKVEVIIEMRTDIPVNEDSVATAASLSALGERYLEVSTGSADAARTEPGGVIRSQETLTLDDLTAQISTVSAEATVLMGDIRANFISLTDRAEILLDNLNELTGERNRQQLESLLENSNQMITEQRPKFDKITTQTSEMLVKVDELLDDMRQIAKHADKTMGNLDQTITETREPLKRDLAQIEATLKDTRRLIEDMQALVVVNEENVNEMLENFRVSSENIERLTDELRQRPWSLIRVKPKPDRQVPVTSGR